MKLYAVFENAKLIALCREAVASSTLEGELYYDFGDKHYEHREIEVSDETWKTLEENEINHE